MNEQRAGMFVCLLLVLFFIPTMTQANGTFDLRPSSQEGKVPETEEFTIRTDNLTLEELDKELEKRGLNDEERSKFVESERRLRESQKKPEDVSAKWGTGLWTTGCWNTQSVNASWASGGTVNNRWREYNNQAYTSWSSSVTCPVTTCNWGSYKAGQEGVRWYGFEAKTNLPYVPTIYGFQCTYPA